MSNIRGASKISRAPSAAYHMYLYGLRVAARNDELMQARAHRRNGSMFAANAAVYRAKRAQKWVLDSLRNMPRQWPQENGNG